MFEGFAFQFPKLGFLLFFFLACEALCPLRSNPLYFPRTPLFTDVLVKPPLWLWVAKWAMITLFVIALMSPVREEKMNAQGGYDILLVIDPAIINAVTLEHAEAFVGRRSGERIGLWIPATPEVIVPLTREHGALASILSEVTPQKPRTPVTTSISRFFTTSDEGKGWAVILTDSPKTFIYSLPVGIKTSVVSPGDEPRWDETTGNIRPPYRLEPNYRYYNYFYVYPLFGGFLAMLAYLYGRNQKGLK